MLFDDLRGGIGHARYGRKQLETPGEQHCVVARPVGAVVTEGEAIPLRTVLGWLIKLGFPTARPAIARPPGRRPPDRAHRATRPVVAL